MKIEQVTRTTVTTRDGELAGYRFTAMVDGEQMVIRELATRPYTVLAVHTLEACCKYRGTSDPRQYMSFHSSRPAVRAGDTVQLVAIVAA